MILIIIIILVWFNAAFVERASEWQGTNPLPEGITNGMVIRDTSTNAKYRIEDYAKRYYSEFIYKTWGEPTFVNVTSATAGAIRDGPAMTTALPDGTIARDTSTGSTYRIE